MPREPIEVEPVFHRGQDILGDLVRITLPVNDDAAFGLGSGNGKKTLPPLCLDAEILFFETVGLGVLPAEPGTLGSDLGRNVEDDGEVGADAVQGRPFEAGKKSALLRVVARLIDPCGVVKAIAQNHRATRQCGADDDIEMVGPCRGKENAFHLGAQMPCGAGEDHMTDRVRSRCPTGLSGRNDIEPTSRQSVGEPADLRGLAASLAALEGDENAGQWDSARLPGGDVWAKLPRSLDLPAAAHGHGTDPSFFLPPLSASR